MNGTIRFSALILVLAYFNTGCTVSEVISADTTELNVASLDISESMLLDVGIINFDAGIPKKNDVEKSGIYPEVRMAEHRNAVGIAHAGRGMLTQEDDGVIRSLPDISDNSAFLRVTDGAGFASVMGTSFLDSS